MPEHGTNRCPFGTTCALTDCPVHAAIESYLRNAALARPPRWIVTWHPAGGKPVQIWAPHRAELSLEEAAHFTGRELERLTVTKEEAHDTTPCPPLSEAAE